jgi:hypothetical protein
MCIAAATGKQPRRPASYYNVPPAEAKRIRDAVAAAYPKVKP